MLRKNDLSKIEKEILTNVTQYGIIIKSDKTGNSTGTPSLASFKNGLADNYGLSFNYTAKQLQHLYNYVTVLSKGLNMDLN